MDNKVHIHLLSIDKDTVNMVIKTKQQIDTFLNDKTEGELNIKNNIFDIIINLSKNQMIPNEFKINISEMLKRLNKGMENKEVFKKYKYNEEYKISYLDIHIIRKHKDELLISIRVLDNQNEANFNHYLKGKTLVEEIEKTINDLDDSDNNDDDYLHKRNEILNIYTYSSDDLDSIIDAMSSAKIKRKDSMLIKTKDGVYMIISSKKIEYNPTHGVLRNKISERQKEFLIKTSEILIKNDAILKINKIGA